MDEYYNEHEDDRPSWWVVVLVILAYGLLAFLCKTYAGYQTIPPTIKTDITKKHQIVVVPLESYDVITQNNVEKPLSQHMANVNAVAGINGSFFCPSEKSYKRCGANGNTSMPVIVNHNIQLNDNDGEVIFGFDDMGLPETRLPKSDRTKFNNVVQPIRYGIAMKPALLVNGKKTVIPPQPSKQASNTKKGFICYKYIDGNPTNRSPENMKVVFGFVNSITYAQLQNYLITQFNCWDAMALDAGGSTNLIAPDSNGNQKTIAKGRNIPNAFVVLPKGRLDYRPERFREETQQSTEIPPGHDKTYICHKDQNNPLTHGTVNIILYIPRTAVPAHLAHGDSLDLTACGTGGTGHIEECGPENNYCDDDDDILPPNTGTYPPVFTPPAGGVYIPGMYLTGRGWLTGFMYYGNINTNPLTFERQSCLLLRRCL